MSIAIGTKVHSLVDLSRSGYSVYVGREGIVDNHFPDEEYPWFVVFPAEDDDTPEEDLFFEADELEVIA